MPVVIRELVITATVDENAAAQTNSAAMPPAEASKKLVQECVEQVLAILREREER